VVVDAVQHNPVSNRNSLLAGNLAGNFLKNGLKRDFLRLISKYHQWVATKFPA
jgi:hypothetical protein